MPERDNPDLDNPDLDNLEPQAPPGGGLRAWGTVGALLLILAGATALRSYDLFRPFGYHAQRLSHKGANGGLYSVAARNHLRYGYRSTRFAMVTCAGERDVAELANHRYLNHPPLFAVLVSLSFRGFGVHEWSARLVPLLCALLSGLVLFGLCRRLAGLRVAFIALLLFAVMPMAVYYGAFVDVQGSPVLLAALVMFGFHWQWHVHRLPVHLAAALLAFLVGAALDWPIYLLALGLFVHHLAAPGASGRSRAIWLWPPAVAAAFAATFAYLGALSPHGGAQLLSSAFVHESVSDPRAFHSVAPWMVWLGKLEHYARAAYTLPLLLLAGFWVARASIAAVFRRAPAGSALVFAFLVMGGGHVVLFPAGSLVHEYWSFYLIPAICVAVALLLGEASRWTAIVGTAALTVYLGSVTLGRLEPSAPAEEAYYVEAGAALRDATRPEDRVCVVAYRTESYILGYYGDRTLTVIEPDALIADPTQLQRIGAPWIAIPADLASHPLRGMPWRHGPTERALAIVRDRLPRSAIPTRVGPLLVFPRSLLLGDGAR